MPKYRKTALIDAHQLGAEGAPEWFENAEETKAIALRDDGWFDVVTAEGPLVAYVGDWIAHNPSNGDIWPIAKTTFEETYERAD